MNGNYYMILHDYLKLCRAPKIDMHMHLQGTGNLHVISYLIKKNKPDVIKQIENDKRLLKKFANSSRIMNFLYSDCMYIDEDSDLFEYSTIQDFFLTYNFLNMFIRSISDFKLYLKGVIIKLEKQNIVHADIIVSLPELIDQGLSIRFILCCLDKIKKTSHISVNWWIDLVRHRGPDNAMNLLEMVIQNNYEGTIYGINLGGDEKTENLDSFKEVFLCAKNNGLKIVVHDGETQFVMNETIYKQYDIIRVGHGLNYIRDNVFIEGLIEVCLGSNYNTKIIEHIYKHPIFEDEYKLNNIVICTDDGTLFKTNLAKELSYILTFYGKSALIRVVSNALRYADLAYKEAILNWYENNF